MVRYGSITDFYIQFNMGNNTFWVDLTTSLDSSFNFSSQLMYNSIFDNRTFWNFAPQLGLKNLRIDGFFVDIFDYY